MYLCPTSQARLIVSNGIPNHAVTLDNPNVPCPINWMVSVPIFPQFSGTNTEVGALGIIGMSLNGIPAYGAQEGGGSNAAELDATTQGVPAWGHAARSGDWHYHSGEFGLVDTVQELGSETLLGYALDGFPIYGPMEDDSVLDECNGIGDELNYRYHVRTLAQVDESLDYCTTDGSAAVNWNYILGCYKGVLTTTSVDDSSTTSIPSDCVLVSHSETGGGGEEEVDTSPTPAPTDAPASGGLCFSGDTLIEVEGVGAIEMKDLKLGDMVHVGNNKYEPVYGFGHYGPDTVGDFLKLSTTSGSVLTMTPDHMIYVESLGFIPASAVQPGHIVLGGHGDKMLIKSTEKSQALGVFAPFTTSGQILVNNVLASSFVAFGTEGALDIGGMKISYQWIARSFEMPHRFACHYIGKCHTESYNEDGISVWVDIPLKISQLILKQTGVLRNALLVACVCVLYFLWAVETLYLNPILVMIGAFVLATALWRHRVVCVKKTTDYDWANLDGPYSALMFSFSA